MGNKKTIKIVVETKEYELPIRAKKLLTQKWLRAAGISNKKIFEFAKLSNVVSTMKECADVLIEYMIVSKDYEAIPEFLEAAKCFPEKFRSNERFFNFLYEGVVYFFRVGMMIRHLGPNWTASCPGTLNPEAKEIVIGIISAIGNCKSLEAIEALEKIRAYSSNPYTAFATREETLNIKRALCSSKEFIDKFFNDCFTSLDGSKNNTFIDCWRVWWNFIEIVNPSCDCKSMYACTALWGTYHGDRIGGMDTPEEDIQKTRMLFDLFLRERGFVADDADFNIGSEYNGVTLKRWLHYSHEEYSDLWIDCVGHYDPSHSPRGENDFGAWFNIAITTTPDSIRNDDDKTEESSGTEMAKALEAVGM